MFFHDPQLLPVSGIQKWRFPKVNSTILELHDLSMEHNPHIALYKTARERLQEVLRVSNQPFRLLITQMKAVLQHGNDKIEKSANQ
jgi:hypothetical protein